MTYAEHHVRAADVAVVGAGPAGATAATFLARSGVNVLVLDQAAFPRAKPCGDCLGYHAVDVLERMGLGDWLRNGDHNACQRFLLKSPDGSSALVPVPADAVGHSYTVPREILDARLVEAAVDAGARFLPETRALGLQRLDDDRVEVIGQRREERVRYVVPLVIAADGGAATFTRALDLAVRPPELVAVRAYYEGATGDPHQFEIHWERSVLPGYGWLFPIDGDRINVGLGALTRDVVRQRLNLKAMLETFAERNAFACERLEGARRVTPIVGRSLRADAPEVTPCADNVLVVGEAAGLVNPLSGDGIAQSMVSGEMAAEYAQSALEQGRFTLEGLAEYGRMFHAHFDRLHRSARTVRAMVNRPWILNLAIRTASRDTAYATALACVLIGQEQPSALFKPGTVLKLLRG
ncbi:MAG: NAD(P)/FAD-dependent oxidoreductase [Anaerolineae bacterium]